MDGKEFGRELKLKHTKSFNILNIEPSKKKKVKESVSFTAVVFGFELPCDSLKENS